MQQAITSTITGQDFQLSAQGPLNINNIIIEESVALFNKSVWSWRGVVRDLEKVHASPLYNPCPQYTQTIHIRYILTKAEPTNNKQ
jgi:hypothetical protein